MIRCHIKPVPPYAAHNRGRFQFLAGARSADDKRKSGVPSDGNDAGMFIVAGDRVVVVDPKATEDRDDEGAPFIMTQASYDMVKQAHGTSIVIEPVDHAEESMKLDARAQELAAARVRAAEAEAEKIKKALEGENRSLRDQLAEAKQKIADFETVMAQATQVGKKR